METITSRNNRTIIECLKLRDKKSRDRTRLFYFEGIKLFREAVDCGLPLKYVFFTDNCKEQICRLPDGTEAFEVTDSVYEKLSDEKSPQGIFCVAEHIDKLHKYATIYNNVDLSKKICGSGYFIVNSVRDPGNLGTILRTALAMGIDSVIMSDDCADIYNSKTVRAGMGAVFKQPTVRVKDINSYSASMSDDGYKIYAAVLDDNSIAVSEVKKSGKGVCFAVGNEGHGLPGSFIEACSGNVKIPMEDNCESMNAAVAASILMWEQRKINRNI